MYGNDVLTYNKNELHRTRIPGSLSTTLSCCHLRCYTHRLPFRLLTKLKLLYYLSRSARWLWLPLYRYSGRAQSELWLEIRWSLPCSCRLLLLYHAHPYLDDQQSGLCSKRGTGVTMLNLIGQFGPLVGTRHYPDSDKPYYITGTTVCSLFMFLVTLLAWWLRSLLAKENKVWNESDGAMGKPEEGLVDQNDPRTKAHLMNIL